MVNYKFKTRVKNNLFCTNDEVYDGLQFGQKPRIKTDCYYLMFDFYYL